MAEGSLLFYVGIILIGVAVAGAVLGTVILSISGRRLKVQLEKEFGEKRK